MTDELGPASRALLDAARDGLAPDAEAIRRMRMKIDATVATTAATGGALAAKLAIVGAIAAVVGIGAIALRGDGERTAAPQLELPAQRVERIAPPAAHEPPPPAPPLIEMDPMQARAPVVAAAPPPAPAPARAPRADLAREVALVDQAMAALRRRDAQAALAAVRLHGSETAGTGQLAEDAAAIEIEALCLLHDPHAGAKLAAFDARWPDSAQRSRLTTRCP
jgi:type IV secretory pathway VirB10-like protein